MRIINLEIQNIRSVERVSMRPDKGVNLLFGKNGSGKTSIMEAVSLLGYSRSFVPCQTKDLIRFGQQQLYVFAEIEHDSGPNDKLGFGYHQKDGKKLRLNSKKTKTDAMVRSLPLAVLSPGSFDILEGAASERRKRIDWGVFHMKQDFRQEWQTYRKLLVQRNAALKNAKRHEDIQHWTDALVKSAIKVTEKRSEYVRDILPGLQKQLEVFGLRKNLLVGEYRGWSETSTLISQMSQGFESDKRQGVTQKGAHRYDLRFVVEGRRAKHVLSRGEKKRVLCALLFAQMEMLISAGRKLVVIIDDLASELDQESTEILTECIAGLCQQTFITSVGSMIGSVPIKASKRFHVEQGVLLES